VGSSKEIKMYEELLENTGLTKNESAVYLALLKKGKSTSYNIVREAKISSGKIYETLDRLQQKGLVKSVIENGVKHFIANDPEALFEYLKQKEQAIRNKEEELHKILPQLKNLKLKEDIEEVALITGFRGISPVVYKALENAKNIKIMGVRSTKNVQFNNFWKNWHRQRILEKKKAQILFSDNGSDYWKFFKELKYTEVKESLTISPSAIMIIDNNSFIFSYEEELKCIHIVSEPTAKSFNGFFDSLWKAS
jgi:sugar-specific transcriptional regulator TrmB